MSVSLRRRPNHRLGEPGTRCRFMFRGGGSQHSTHLLCYFALRCSVHAYDFISSVDYSHSHQLRRRLPDIIADRNAPSKPHCCSDGPA